MADKNTDIKLHLLEPRATEKSYLEQTNRIYIFPVKKSMGKHEIAKMVLRNIKILFNQLGTSSVFLVSLISSAFKIISSKLA